jgi:hypothetical protein
MMSDQKPYNFFSLTKLSKSIFRQRRIRLRRKSEYSYQLSAISYQLSAVSHVTLKVYDILGREVATLVDEIKEAGTHHYPFSIEHYTSPSGVYSYQLRAGLFMKTKNDLYEGKKSTSD